MKLPGLLALTLALASLALPGCLLSFDENRLHDAGSPDRDSAPDPDAGPDTGICTGGMTDCDGECVNLRTDEANCGECGNTCGNQQTCVGSHCSTDNGQ